MRRKNHEKRYWLLCIDLKVMQSNAGYYVGRDYWEKAYPEIKMPYSRESDYFPTREQAHNCLQIMRLEMSLEGS